MARELRQSTSVDVPIGPFLDPTDGVTPETGLTITQPDVRLKKNGAAWAQKAAAQTLSHEENGFYEVTLDATDTDTLGLLRLAVFESGAAPVWEDFEVVAQSYWDAKYGSGNFPAAVNTIATGAITATAIAANAIGASELATDAVTEIATAARVEMDSNSTKLASIDTAASDARDNALLLLDILAPVRSLTADSGTTTTLVDADLTGFADDYFNGGLVVFTTGSLAGQSRQVTDFVAATGTVTFSPAATTAVTTEQYAILPNDPPPTAPQNATELLDQAAGVETNRTVRQALRLILAVLAGKASGMETTTATFRDTNDSKDRVVATVDSDGNRTAVTLDAS